MGEPIETDDSRVTITRFIACGHNMVGQALVSAELEIENFGDKPLDYPSRATYADADGRVYDYAWSAVGPCQPGLENQLGTPPHLLPGGKVRGFLDPVAVPRNATAIELRYAFGDPPKTYRIAVGPFPDRPERWPWQPPPSRSVTGKGYRVTVTNVRNCESADAPGHIWVGVEIAVENTSTAHILGNAQGTLEDAAHYRHQPAMNGSLTACKPDVGNPFELAPGGKVRGWLELFNVERASGPWTLHYTLRWSDGADGTSVVDLPVGGLGVAPAP